MGRGLLGLIAFVARLALALPFAVCPNGPPPSSKDLVRDDAPRNGNALAQHLLQVVDVFRHSLARGCKIKFFMRIEGLWNPVIAFQTENS